MLSNDSKKIKGFKLGGVFFEKYLMACSQNLLKNSKRFKYKT